MASAALGAESSWPHGVGTRPASESSTDPLPSLASCNSVAWATNATAAAILRSNSPYLGQSRMLPSNASSSCLSTMLASHGRLKGRRSVTPTSWQVQSSKMNGCPFWYVCRHACWTLLYSCVHVSDVCAPHSVLARCCVWLQELVALSNRAKEGQASTKADIAGAYFGKAVAEGPPDAKLPDQEEHLLRQFLSPRVCHSRQECLAFTLGIHAVCALLIACTHSNFHAVCCHATCSVAHRAET